MKLGFTGTQNGMTENQKATLTELLMLLPPGELHHGDCIGADAEAGATALAVGFYKVITHPPTNESKRAYSKAHVVRNPRPYLDRNRDIVNETDILVAAPAEATEQRRSGTWATIRYARKARRPIVFLWP